MFNINNNMTITISQGDSAEFPLFLNQGSAISPIRYRLTSEDNNEVYFYIYEVNDSRLDRPVFVKKYQTNGTITAYLRGIQIYQKFGQEVINENSDLILSFIPEDTKEMEPIKYKYQVKVKLKTGENVYSEYTVTNKHDLNIINDDYDDRPWE